MCLIHKIVCVHVCLCMRVLVRVCECISACMCTCLCMCARLMKTAFTWMLLVSIPVFHLAEKGQRRLASPMSSQYKRLKSIRNRATRKYMMNQLDIIQLHTAHIID